MNYLTKIKIGFFLIVFGIMASACEGTTTSSQVQSILFPCDEPLTDLNVYKIKSLTQPSGSIFVRAFPADFLSTDIYIRQEAIGVLKDQLKRWSDYEDILVTDNRIVRITLTYISPDLVEIIFLNQKLSQQFVSKAQFIGELREHLEYLAKRDELIFLLTVTDSRYTPQISGTDVVILNIPMANMMLLNSENHYATFKHFDPPLGQDIHISRKHLSGYLTFPMSVQKNGTCVPMLDPMSNTMITIKATGINLTTNTDDIGNYQIAWSLKYHALMDLKITPTPASYNSNVTPQYLPIPPTPNLIVVDLPDAYWEEMARYVWTYVVNP